MPDLPRRYYHVRCGILSCFGLAEDGLETHTEGEFKTETDQVLPYESPIPFLGHIVSREGIRVDPANTEAVEKWPTPVDVKDVRAFLGLASYYRRYIPGFSMVAAPMTNLT